MLKPQPQRELTRSKDRNFPRSHPQPILVASPPAAATLEPPCDLPLDHRWLQVGFARSQIDAKLSTQHTAQAATTTAVWLLHTQDTTTRCANTAAVARTEIRVYRVISDSVHSGQCSVSVG